MTTETPLLEAADLADDVGAARVYIKPESLQVAGSFKIRGATWKLHSLAPDQRERGVIAYSSGNFAQGLAAAGRQLGVAVTIVMPEDAPSSKREATERLGATVVSSHHGDRPREEVAHEMARQLASEQGLTLVHPFDDPVIVAGQAGAGLAALEQLQSRGAAVDTVLVSVGGGGLIGGVGLAFHHCSPDTAVVAVEPEGYDAMGQSLARGEITRVASGRATICDALQATSPGVAPFAAAQLAGVTGIHVDDHEVREAVRSALQSLRLVLEPSGAVALAGLRSGRVPVEGRRILVYATGGNISAPDLRRLLQP